jgi:hypothetical protein
LTHGQDLVFNYIVFLQFRLHDGVHTLCAMAQAPCELLQNQIITLKLVLAGSPREMHKGAVAGILDMMTCSSDMFVAAMETFPKTSRNIVQPYHIGHGECLEIKCDGISSLCESDIGAEMNFLDMNQAHRNGMFGTKAKIWRDDEWALLLDYLCGGITHSKKDWESLEWRSQVWDTDDQKVTTPSKARKARIRELAARAAKPDGYLKHQMSIKAFSADDALSTITESTACNSDGEASEATFSTASREVWDKSLARELKHTKNKARGTAAFARGNSLGKAKRAEGAPKRTSGASSSSVATA